MSEVISMNKTAIITGGTRGIGRAVAIKFYELGYNIALVYNNNEENANEFCSAFDTDRVLLIKADVSSFDEMQKMGRDVISKFKRVDVLVNNAGISEQKMINDITESDWDNMFSVNVKGAFNCTKAVLQNMIHNKSGKIINISSMWGITGASCEVHYSASKAALIGFTKSLAKELGPSGITVNCVAPGLIETDMNSSFSKDIINEIVNETPVMRIGTGKDVAESVAFLASDDAEFITGQVLSVNGGLVI